MSDHTQGNWNGIVGTLQLRREPSVWLDDVQVYPDVTAKQVRVRVVVGNRSGAAGEGTLTLAARSTGSAAEHVVPPRQYPIRWDPQPTQLELEYPLGDDVRLWDEFEPHRYRLTVELAGAAAAAASGTTSGSAVRSVDFGMRELGTQGTQFTLNGRKIFLRARWNAASSRKRLPAHRCASRGSASSDRPSHGLNNLRFHSWCPPEAAFAAADEVGFYFHVECPPGP